MTGKHILSVASILCAITMSVGYAGDPYINVPKINSKAQNINSIKEASVMYIAGPNGSNNVSNIGGITPQGVTKVSTSEPICWSDYALGNSFYFANTEFEDKTDVDRVFDIFLEHFKGNNPCVSIDDIKEIYKETAHEQCKQSNEKCATDTEIERQTEALAISLVASQSEAHPEQPITMSSNNCFYVPDNSENKRILNQMIEWKDEEYKSLFVQNILNQSSKCWTTEDLANTYGNYCKKSRYQKNRITKGHEIAEVLRNANSAN